MAGNKRQATGNTKSNMKTEDKPENQRVHRERTRTGKQAEAHRRCEDDTGLNTN